jgi:hypothetical protein
MALTVIGGLSLLIFHASPGSAEENRQGHGHASVGYQYISVDGFESSIGTLDVGTTDTHAFVFDLEYNVTDRLALNVGLPLVMKRYQGPLPHRVSGLDPPNDTAPFIDDGRYHTRWQDFHFGARYLAKSGSLQIEPYVGLEIPSNEYPFYALAAVGQNVNKLEIGTSFTYVPPISDAFFRLVIGHVFVEETLGVNIDHWRVRGGAGYFFAPRLSGRAFFLLKEGNGLIFPDDFPPPRTDEHWYQHDRMVRHNYMNIGVGLDYAFNEKYAVSLSVMTMAWAEQILVMKYATNVSVIRSF